MKTIASMFNCTTFIDGQKYLIADLTVKCYEGIHILYLTVASVGVVVYAIGIPVFVAIVTALKTPIVCRGNAADTATGDEGRRRRKNNDCSLFKPCVNTLRPLWKKDKNDAMGRTISHRHLSEKKIELKRHLSNLALRFRKQNEAPPSGDSSSSDSDTDGSDASSDNDADGRPEAGNESDASSSSSSSSSFSSSSSSSSSGSTSYSTSESEVQIDDHGGGKSTCIKPRFICARRRHAKYATTDVRTRFGFLFAGYSTNRSGVVVSWEALVMLRKLAVTLAGAMISDPYLQVLSALLILVVSCVATAFIQPYETLRLNMLDVTATFMLIVTQIFSIIYFCTLRARCCTPRVLRTLPLHHLAHPLLQPPSLSPLPDVETSQHPFYDPTVIERVVTIALFLLNGVFIVMALLTYVFEVTRHRRSYGRSVVKCVIDPNLVNPALKQSRGNMWRHPVAGHVVKKPPRRVVLQDFDSQHLWMWSATSTRGMFGGINDPELLVPVAGIHVLKAGEYFRWMSGGKQLSKRHCMWEQHLGGYECCKSAAVPPQARDGANEEEGASAATERWAQREKKKGKFMSMLRNPMKTTEVKRFTAAALELATMRKKQPKNALPEGWVKHVQADSGTAYYVHEDGHSTWESPAAPPPPARESVMLQLSKVGDAITRMREAASAKDAALPAGWEEMQNDEGHTYYYHAEKRESVWEPPSKETVADKLKRSKVGGAITRLREAAVAKDAALPAGWAEMQNDEGHTYYYHAEKNESLWEPPSKETIAEKLKTAFAGKSGASAPLPEGWQEKVHVESGTPYYEHATSGESVWERPAAPVREGKLSKLMTHLRRKKKKKKKKRKNAVGDTESSSVSSGSDVSSVSSDDDSSDGTSSEDEAAAMKMTWMQRREVRDV